MQTLLKGKWAVISGASSGFGKATALSLAKEGMHLVILARRKERLEELRLHCQNTYGVEVIALPADLSQPSSLNEALTTLPSHVQAPDLLINNAGLVYGMATLAEVTPEEWGPMIDVNIRGALYLTRFFLPHMLKKQNGHILNVASTSSHGVYAGGGVYCATKYALKALTDTLRVELVSTPLRVSMISPGMAETEFSEVRFHGDKEKAKGVYKGMVPLTAEDIAEAILFIVTRPPHVNIADLIMYPKQQALPGIVHKQTA